MERCAFDGSIEEVDQQFLQPMKPTTLQMRKLVPTMNSSARSPTHLCLFLNLGVSGASCVASMAGRETYEDSCAGIDGGDPFDRRLGIMISGKNEAGKSAGSLLGRSVLA